MSDEPGRDLLTAASRTRRSGSPIRAWLVGSRMPSCRSLRVVALAFLLIGSVVVPIPVVPANAATGDQLADITVPVQTGIGTAVDFDGQNLWYANWSPN